MKAKEVMATLEAKYSPEKEYLQAVQEVLESIEEVYNQHPNLKKQKSLKGWLNPTESSLSVLPGLTTRVKYR
jgi:glutamate dehydrogenase (NADP+)